MLKVLLAAAIALVPAAVPASADVSVQDTRPPECASHFKDPNPRQRTINRDTNLHEMSNPPVCSPHGPYLGALRAGSTFIVYHADPYEPLWCYGYSWQLARTGYILCEAYDLPAAPAEPTTAELREPCNGTYTHCETNRCEAGRFYRNYDPTADHFSWEWGDPLVKGEQGDIRDEPYRRYGPRGVRAMHAGQWGFYSTACFP
ncbi:hypothetical protein [Actinophytocola algeriensis]|uniref:Uncharacterized protein n=1 Tax=Actinophytocola algeriensis TaxID=1768010 RepID=A0A7W7VGW7_9PSEU|nr:hypothetical protein [Actinophytocola algeriensis]MBB4909912.1 hypothetical protein [Actinophytocola algeriensis]MBE1475902.1 hypothetical protein [Actinophytocola algeriensis]